MPADAIIVDFAMASTERTRFKGGTIGSSVRVSAERNRRDLDGDVWARLIRGTGVKVDAPVFPRHRECVAAGHEEIRKRGASLIAGATVLAADERDFFLGQYERAGVRVPLKALQPQVLGARLT